MESLINQAFAHVDHLSEWVHLGHYDLLGPDGEIIMPQYWRETVQPDMQITMMMWPLPDKKSDDDDIVLPMDGDGILSLDDILNPGDGDGGRKKKKKDKDKHRDKEKEEDKGEKKEKKRQSKAPTGLAAWMIGGTSGKRTLKK
jgi:hypothetical protein